LESPAVDKSMQPKSNSKKIQGKRDAGAVAIVGG
jgi:hypothetical protein